METPIITQKQKRKTLSAKRAKKETIKNVVVKPHQEYWPLLSEEDCKNLQESLEKLLPRVKNDVRLPYNEIKSIPKDKRREHRLTKAPPIDLNDNMIFGVNNVSKLQEKNEVGSVLVADDVQPRLFVQHVIDQAVLHRAPVLIVPKLREVLKEKCGISSAVFAIRKAETLDSLGPLQEQICRISRNYPVPETHVNFHRKLAEEINDAKMEDSVRDVVVVDSDGETAEAPSVNCHLIRTDRTSRVCIPGGEKSCQDSEFIGFSDDTVQMESPKSPPGQYRSLVVKRVRGDKKRNKRKLGGGKK